MDLLRKYKVVFGIVLTILILIAFRLISPGHFKIDAKKWAEPSVLRSNIVTTGQIGTLPGEKLIINLDSERSEISMIPKDALNLVPDSLLRKKNLNAIKNHDGPVLLFSSATAVSARIWMLLSQMGYKNIFILTTDRDNEILNYKFRPDTTIRPEL